MCLYVNIQCVCIVNGYIQSDEFKCGYPNEQHRQKSATSQEIVRLSETVDVKCLAQWLTHS